jgi:hypothetical protein
VIARQRAAVGASSASLVLDGVASRDNTRDAVLRVDGLPEMSALPACVAPTHVAAFP